MKAIITGATKGIGLAIAEEFVNHGISVAICSRSIEELGIVAGNLKAKNVEVEVIYRRCDVSKKQEIEEFASFVIGEWPDIDILVNNAGVFFPGELCAEKDGVLEQTIETNLYSAYHLTRIIVPLMKNRSKGHIVNLCSIASLIAYPNGGSYTISKFAMLGFSKVLREELKSFGVKVTSVMPGATWSDSWTGVDLPKSRLIEAKDIARLVYTCISLGETAVVEDLVVRPQLGDL